MPLEEISYIIKKLQWMEDNKIWPNGLRYLWTDAFGVVLYVSLYEHTGDISWLNKAEDLVTEVYRVLGRQAGLRIGEAEDRDGQYYHYLAMWLYALICLGRLKSSYQSEAIKLVKQIHSHFVIPGLGVIWKMEEDLSGPYPGYGLGAMDAYDGYVVYKLLDEDILASEINDMYQLISQTYNTLIIDQDLGLGMMLWLCHFFPNEEWSLIQKKRSFQQLEQLWIEKPGYFCRQTGWQEMKFAFTNYGISLGLQSWDKWLDRVNSLNTFFEDYRSGNEYDTNAITHVMACSSHFPGLFI
jgi:hypothetical protein